jgi:hypothetical protein
MPDSWPQVTKVLRNGQLHRGFPQSDNKYWVSTQNSTLQCMHQIQHHFSMRSSRFRPDAALATSKKLIPITFIGSYQKYERGPPDIPQNRRYCSLASLPPHFPLTLLSRLTAVTELHLPPEGGRCAPGSGKAVNELHLPPERGMCAPGSGKAIIELHLPPERGRRAPGSGKAVNELHLPPERGR